MVGDLYINSISRQQKKNLDAFFLLLSVSEDQMQSSWRKTTTMQEAAGGPQELER
jgi:hypothetical protein